MFSACYAGKISRFARNDKWLRLFTSLSTMTLISKLYKPFELNSQYFSFFNGCPEGLLKMSRVKLFFVISGSFKGFFQADRFFFKLHIRDELYGSLITRTKNHFR